MLGEDLSFEPPWIVELYADLGDLHAAKGSLKGDDARFWNALGYALHEKAASTWEGCTAEICAKFEKAIQLDPDYTMARESVPRAPRPPVYPVRGQPRVVGHPDEDGPVQSEGHGRRGHPARGRIRVQPALTGAS